MSTSILLFDHSFIISAAVLKSHRSVSIHDIEFSANRGPDYVTVMY